MGSRLAVLTMGRVGSLSVAQSLEAAIGSEVPHLHSVDPFKISRQVVRAGSPQIAPRSVQAALEFLRKSVASTSRLRIVSLVREPIDRNVSAAFTSFRKKMGPITLREAIDDPRGLEKLWGAFNDRRPFSWFQEEVEGVLRVPVFDGEPIREGVGEWTTPDVDLLVMRSDLPTETQEAVLARFVELDVITLEPRNVENQGLSDYRDFRRNLRLDPDYVASCWQSEYMQQFFPDISLASYLEKWASS